MFTLLRRLHTEFKARVTKWLRTRYVLKTFQSAHAHERAMTPVHDWPVLMARQSDEIAAIRAGKLDIVERKSWMFPYLPASIQRMSVPILKAIPYNLRRMSRTPVARRAMNMIKGAIISMPLDIIPIDNVPVDNKEEQAARIDIAKNLFALPNNDDSLQTFIEKGLEDFLCIGAFVAELALTPDPERPLKMWPVAADSIRLFASWKESTPNQPHYAQMTGLKGERGAVLFYDDEMLYIKDNPATDTPFGVSKMEVGFASVMYLLGVQDMSGRAGADQIHKTWLWWEAPQSDSAFQTVRRHIQNDMEGQAKVAMMGGMKKPEVIEINPVTEGDLLLKWQEMLIRMVANAFDMSAIALGIEHDINRAVGEVLSDKDFRTAVVPCAKRLQEGFTRKILHGKLGWYDLQCVYQGLDDPDFQTKLDMCGRLYQMNAITPNGILKRMGMKQLDNGYADLTQFEAMLLNIQAQGEAADMQAEHAMARNQQAMLQMQQMQQMQPGGGDDGSGGGKPPPPGPGGMPPSQLPGDREQDQGGGQPGKGGGPSKGTGQGPSGAPGLSNPESGGGGKGAYGQPKSPKVMALPKFPIQGTKYNARQIAQMPLNRLADVYQGSGLKATAFINALDEQEPGILETMADAVKVYLERQLEEQDEASKQQMNRDRLVGFEKQLKQRMAKDAARESNMTDWLYRTDRGAGTPGRLNSDSNMGLNEQAGIKAPFKPKKPRGKK